jgi:hypothetical protein
MSLLTPKSALLVACLLVGAVLLIIAACLLIADIHFAFKAVTLDATIVEVRRESVRKGKGDILAYVPVIELEHSDGTLARVEIDTYSNEPIYRVGSKMQVMCELSSSKCIQNTFLDIWGNFLIDFGFAIVFLFFPIRNKWRTSRLVSSSTRGDAM